MDAIRYIAKVLPDGHLSLPEEIKEQLECKMKLAIIEDKKKKLKEKLKGLNENLDEERYEYDIFLDYIDRQINHYCNKLFQMNDLQGFKDLPCNEKVSHSNNRSLKDIKTTEEQIVTMELRKNRHLN